MGNRWAVGPLLRICLAFLESRALPAMEESSIAAFDLLTPGPTGAFDMLTDPFSAW